VGGYAQELAAADLSKSGTRLIDPQERLVIVETLYRSDDSLGGSGCYFEGASDIPGILKCLGRAVHELRMAGIDHETVDPASFIIRAKGQELARLLVSYDRFLKENLLIDHAGMIRMAAGKIKAAKGLQKSKTVMVLSDFPLAHLEKELIGAAGGETLKIIEHTRPIGMNFPQRFWAFPEQTESKASKPAANIDLLPWIFRPEKAPASLKDESVSMFCALGESNEVREVFRRVFKKELPLDDVEILIARDEPYICLIHEIAGSLNVPVTFAGGLPITYTRPGRALILYFKWQAEDFLAGHLKTLFSGGYLDLDRVDPDKEKPSAGRAAAIIRDASIGWGRDRYSSRLKSLENGYLSTAEERREDGEAEHAGWAEQQAGRVAWLAGAVEKIAATVPYTHPEETVTLNDLCTGAIEFLGKFCCSADEQDAAAKLRLAEFLGSIARAPSISNPAKETAERLAGMISEISVGHANPRAGAIHVAHYRSGGYSGRNHTFVLGLDQNRFPGVLAQDPVLLDVERQQLGSQMPLSNQLLEENVYAIAKVLGSLEKNVTLSYSCRDLREDRELFPSSLLLGVYRLITSDRDGDYSALIKFIGAPAGFVPGPDMMPLNDWEWWFSQKQAGYGSKSVHTCYPHLSEGERAESSRDNEKLSEYDGWIPSAAGSMDPLKPDEVLSCSRLEALAKCPYAFFIRHVLGIEALDEVQKDMNRWLDPLQRGELLHEVFYRFMTELKSKGELPELKTHLGLLEAIAKEEVERWKAEVPPASEMALNRELRDIKLALEIFLKNEEQHCKTSEPCFFELSFGMGVEKTPDISSQDPVKIDLQPNGSFNLRGRIDRVDRCGEHEYEVWDYKTGGTWGYREEGYLNRGRHLQHALYAAAAEILLRRNQDRKARVVRAGYFFPSPKGEGFRIEKNQTARGELNEVMESLFELLRSGVFPATCDKDSCGICDYEAICGGSGVAVERSKMKLAKDKKMQPLKRLADHA
jgi:ATP-dependent helicase/nuclease subunit B